jgi:peptide/nickel transport system permease protein
MLLIAALVAVLAPVIRPYPPGESNLADGFLPPSATHWFGTDNLGRDILSRVISGAPIALQVVAEVLLIAGLIGTLLGVLSGYCGGLVDSVIMRAADLFLAFPNFLLAMALAAAFGASLGNAMLAVAISLWPRYARLVRGQFQSLREETFVEAAHAIGVGPVRIAVVHILRNCMGPLLIQSSLDAALAILTTASLSFIGLGASPPTPEWGVMISDTRIYIMTFWWMPLFPGIAISYLSMAFLLVGDGLQDLLNPMLRQRQEATS